ncbi:MAG: four helix bundle protein [Cyclobacteriaceae bacterium]|jgi:four helix bundle protein|nr:four helix bundle protein [Cyclobacteriaceae bacterium]
MGNIITYQDLDVWQQNRILVKMVYQHSQVFPKEEQFGLTQQIRKSAISIPSNIAEGCGRNHTKDSLQFFYIARGSIYELETQLILANDLNYLKEDSYDLLKEQIIRCKKLLNGFINYFSNQSNNEQQTTVNETLKEYGNINWN